MEEKILAFKEVAEKEEAAAKLMATQTPEEMVAVLEQYGLTMTVDELGAVLKAIADTNSAEELTEADLDNVAGGGWIRKIAEVVRRCYTIYREISRGTKGW